VTEIGFYHLTSSTLDDALPRLLEKVLASGRRAVLRAAAPERLEALDRLLWTYEKDSFLPHGTKADGLAAAQPIWLTTGEDVPNGATVLVLVDGNEAVDMAVFARVVDLFDGNDTAAVGAARERWRRARTDGHTLVYWQQGPRGGWQAAHRVEGTDPSATDGPSL